MRVDVADLNALDDGLWSVDMHAYDKGVHICGRMMVARLGDGGLWLHSAVPIDDALAAKLAELGDVRHIVAPNHGHYLFAQAAHDRYPEATLWGAPGLAQKRPELAIGDTLHSGECFGGAFDAIAVQGIRFSNEVVFLHRDSKTLICTDLVHNVHEEAAFFTRQLWRAMGTWQKFGQNRRFRWMSDDKAAFRASMDAVLEWPFDRVAMAHGELLPTDGPAAMRKATAWLRG